MKNNWLVIVIVTVCLLQACATAQQRRQDYVNEHTDLGRDIAAAILEGRLMEGMTAADVRASWGDPDRETLSLAEGGNQEIWSYDTPIGQFMEGTVILTLMNGKLNNLVN